MFPKVWSRQANRPASRPNRWPTKSRNRPRRLRKLWSRPLPICANMSARRLKIWWGWRTNNSSKLPKCRTQWAKRWQTRITPRPRHFSDYNKRWTQSRKLKQSRSVPPAAQKRQTRPSSQNKWPMLRRNRPKRQTPPKNSRRARQTRRWMPPPNSRKLLKLLRNWPNRPKARWPMHYRKRLKLPRKPPRKHSAAIRTAPRPHGRRPRKPWPKHKKLQPKRRKKQHKRRQASPTPKHKTV